MFVDEKPFGEALTPTTPSLKGFVEWLEGQDPNQEYDWFDHKACVCGRYSISLGKYWCNEFGSFTGSYKEEKIYRLLNEIASDRPWTFGAALARAKALLP